MLVMEKGKTVKSVVIELADGKVIKSLQENESYKYLGISEADKFLEEKMKLNLFWCFFCTYNNIYMFKRKQFTVTR